MRLYQLRGLSVISILLFAVPALADEPVSTPTAIPTLASDHATSSPLAQGEDARVVRWTTSYNEARKLGKKSNRPVMLFVTMEGCHYCVKMENESFRHVTVATELVDSFVPAKVYLDPESKLAKSLKITIFPTTMVIAPDGSIVEYIRGYVPREEFEGKLLASKVECDRQVRLAQASKDASASEIESR